MLICHTIMCGLGILIGFFGIMMTFGKSIQFKYQDINQSYMNEKNHAKLKVEFHDVIGIHIEIKE